MQPTGTPDKNIVDRRRSVRNSDMRKTVQRTRDKLAISSGDQGSFVRDMMEIHAAAVLTGIGALPLLIMAAAVLGLFIGFDISIMIWAGVASSSYAILAFIARKFTHSPDSYTHKRWIQLFTFGHFVAGLTWSFLAFDTCHSCSPGAADYYGAALILLAIAATGTIGYAFKVSILAAFGIPVTVYTLVKMYERSFEGIASSAVLIGALIFFHFVASRLHRVSLLSLAYKNENQTLIAELEMAKSISDEARRRAEESNLAKSRFLASMSHELRTPLNAILGFSEAMTSEVFGKIENDHYRSYAEDIHNSGRHLLNLINEILDLSRVEAGKYELREEQLKLQHIVEDCLALIRMKVQQKSINIVTAFQEDLPRVLVDEKSARQITLNLLSNAVKFTPSNGQITVKVGWTTNGGQYISVKDNGPGIPEEEIPIVLSAFGQGSIAIKNAEQGTGLGLPIVQALLKMHGGNFDLRSKLREGTEVIASFPRSRVLESMPAEPVNGSAKDAIRMRPRHLARAS